MSVIEDRTPLISVCIMRKFGADHCGKVRLSSLCLKYGHCPYPHIEASDIQWCCSDTISAGLKLLGTFKLSRKLSSFRYFSHLLLVASSTGSSKLIDWQMSCNIFFPTSTTIAVKPKGSWIELIVGAQSYNTLPLSAPSLHFSTTEMWGNFDLPFKLSLERTSSQCPS